jgi:hypothetical protein
VYGKTPQLRPKQAIIGRMRAAAPAVHRNKITPHAWALFRISQCQVAHPDSKKHPTIDMVFSQKTISKNLAFFRSRSESLDVLRKVELTQAHGLLLEKWEKLRLAVSSPKYPEGGVVTRALVEQLLPAAEYQRLATMIPKERQARQSELMRRAAAGEWIW